MADSFESMYRELRLWVPELPIYLAKKLIRDRYRRIAEKRGWSALRAEGELLINAAVVAGTVTVTRGATTVVGVGTTWGATDVGRQFLVGGRAPIYTVLSVESATGLTLDRVYGGESGAGKAYRILDAYVTPPSDFKRFIVVYDPQLNWRLRHWITQEELAQWDPARSYAGTPWALADRKYSSAGRPQYELWPYSVTAKNLPFYYIKQIPDLVLDTDEPFYPLRGHEIVAGAKADLCRWPGTAEQPNPLFAKAIELSRSFESIYNDAVDDVEREDESIFMTWLQEASWATAPAAPLDARFLQSHAF